MRGILLEVTREIKHDSMNPCTLQHVRQYMHSSRARRVCSTCAPRVHHVCTTCAPRVHLYFVGISEEWSGQGLPQYNENITILFLRAQVRHVRENTGAHVVHTWCTRAAHVLHTCCTRAARWARGRVASARILGLKLTRARTQMLVDT